MCSMTLHWRKLISLSQQISMANSFMVKGNHEMVRYIHLFSDETLSSVNLCRSLWVILCFSPLCVEEAVSLDLSITSGPLYLPASSSTWVPEPWAEGFHKDIPLRDDCSRVSHSQLMGVEQCSAQWVEQYAISCLYWFIFRDPLYWLDCKCADCK